jgi:hypothetical protein
VSVSLSPAASWALVGLAVVIALLARVLIAELARTIGRTRAVRGARRWLDLRFAARLGAPDDSLPRRGAVVDGCRLGWVDDPPGRWSVLELDDLPADRSGSPERTVVAGGHRGAAPALTRRAA